MSANPRRHVLVGVDGSDSSMVALDWALDEARSRSLSLRIVTALDWPVQAVPLAAFPATGAREAAEEEARQLVDDAIAHCRATAPDLDVSGAVVPEPPVSALLRSSRDSALLVVGSRGLNAVMNALLGSVSAAVAAHAHCPVAVIRGKPAEMAAAPVVAGIDGSERDEATLEAAFDEATRYGSALVVVHAWSDVPLVGAVGLVLGGGVTWVELERGARELAERQVARWSAKYPGVPVQIRVTHDQPAAVLLELGRTARLLVVGSHGRGGFAGMVLGSVANRLVHHAECPVLVVRHTTAQAEAPHVAPTTDTTTDRPTGPVTEGSHL